MEERSKIALQIRTTQSERDWFHAVAKSQGISLSELVRQSVAIEGARAGVPAPAALHAA